MFVVAMKTTRTRLAVWGMVLMALVAVMLAGSNTPAAVSANTDPERVTVLTELGYRVDPQWTAVQEITIPTWLDTAWESYNEMQKACGYDLIPYLGKRVKCYTYRVLNHPDGDAVATLYEYNDKVVAGDVSAVGAEGFRHGLQPQGEANGATG